MARLNVTKSDATLIQPANTTPSETLALSPIDQHPARRLNSRNLFIYKYGPGAARVIRGALSKVLVPYYPFAGRITGQVPGELQVDCNCEGGVIFVEAIADSTLAKFDYFEDMDSGPYGELLPDRYEDTDGKEPLMLLQVTQFECGGFILGLVFSHTITDAVGSVQFLNALAEFARGLETLSIEPIWSRDFLSPADQASNNPRPLPPRSRTPPPHLVLPVVELERITIDIALDRIAHLKLIMGRKCSTFEAVVATFWMSWAHAMRFDRGTEVKLVFLANGREFLDPPLPHGFYGNCTFPMRVSAASEWLENASITDVVTLIQEAKSKLPEEIVGFKERLRKYLEGGPDLYAPFPTSFDTCLYMTSLVNVGFNGVDFGWGPPAHVVTVQEPNMTMIAIVQPLARPRQGIRVMARCIRAEHHQDLIDRVGEVLATS